MKRSITALTLGALVFVTQTVLADVVSVPHKSLGLKSSNHSHKTLALLARNRRGLPRHRCLPCTRVAEICKHIPHDNHAGRNLCKRELASRECRS